MRRFVVASAFVLCACVPAGEEEHASRQAAATAEPVYIVRGEDRENFTPGWSASLRGGRLYLDSPTSAGWYAVPAAAPRTSEARQTIAAPGLTLRIDAGACALPALEARFPDRAVLEWDGGRFEGCGGRRAPVEEMAGTVWELERVGDDRAPLSRSPAATLLFDPNGGVGGTLACNDGGVETSWDSGGFVTRGGGFTQTQMGCDQPAAEAFGARFWNGMTGASRWRRDGDRLIVTLGDGSEAELSRLL